MAISYYSHDHLQLAAGDTLICDASDECVAAGVTSGQLLKRLHGKGVNVYHRAGLHAKVASIGHFVVVGSANSSSNSEFALTEAAVLSQEITLRSQVLAFIETVKRESEELDGDEVSRLAAIPVERRRGGATTKPVKVKRGTAQAWWLATHPMSDALNEREKDEAEEGLQEARTRLQDPDAELEPIRWPLNSRVGRDAKEGDVVVQVFSEGPASKRKTTVFAPASIVHRKVVENRVRIYLQPLLSTPVERPLKKVLEVLSKVDGVLPGAKSAREISQQQVEAVATLFS